jgi:formate--tetrahydrofolate ligase
VARAVVRLVEDGASGAKGFTFVYPDEAPLLDKIGAIATKIYGAAGVSASDKVREQIRRLEEAGHGHYPVCVAKTQYSFSTDPAARGAPSGHTLNIREVRLAAGAEFIVMICGDVMTMPGLPKVSSAEKIDVDENGRVVGLF